MDPQIRSAQFYRELGTWLKTLGEYALAQADQLEGAAKTPGEEPAEQAAPAHWLEAFASGPPDDWIRLVEQAGVTGWISSQDFSQSASPSPSAVDLSAQVSLFPGEGSGPVELSPLVPGMLPAPEPRGELQTAERTPAVIPPQKRNTTHSKETTPYRKPVGDRAGQPMPPETLRRDEGTASLGPSEPVMKAPGSIPEQAALSQEHAAVQAPAPVEFIPTRPVTRLRLCASPENSAGHREAITERELGENTPPAEHAAPIKRAAGENLPPVQSPVPQPRAQVPVRARIILTREAEQNEPSLSQRPAGSPSAEPETKGMLVETARAEQSAQQSPLTEARLPITTPESSYAPRPNSQPHPSTEEAQTPIHEPVPSRAPIYPPRPITLQPPPRLPTVSGHWPDLPRRDPRPDSNADRERAPDRRQRLDQEQQGRPWNA